jgi:hypothetical protein
MNNPWDQWSPHWWQSVTAASPLGMRFQPSATYAQPNDIWSEKHSSSTPPAVPSSASSGILGQLGHLPDEFSGYASPKPMSLLGRFLTGVGMAQAIPNGLQAETEAGVGNYITPAQSRSINMDYCVHRYVRCHDLHGGSMLRNGKRCEDCFNMCTLYGTWPYSYCPL